jgi:N-acetylglucosamine malate deacetylase 2
VKKVGRQDLTPDEPRLLFVFAHPDDESFQGVGLACLIRSRGGRVWLTTATRGEEGQRGDPPVCTPDELPAVREAELRAAAAIMGVERLDLLGYRDRSLADAPHEDVRQRLVATLRALRPQVVVTFDPHGFNLHPDHVAISRFTTDAVAAAADPRWYPETGDPHVVTRLLWTPPAATWDVPDAERHAHPGFDFVVDVRQWLPERVRALRAHRSQHVLTHRYFFSRADVDEVLGIESYRLGFGQAPDPRPAADPFGAGGAAPSGSGLET